MPEPTEPSKPRGPKGAAKPSQEPTAPDSPDVPSEQPPAGSPAAPSSSSDAPTTAMPAQPSTQPLPAVSEAAASEAAGSGAGGSAHGAAAPSTAPSGQGGPPGGGPGWPGGPFAAGPGAGGPGGPPPKHPGLWRQATSTTGGTIAVIVAGCLAALMVLGVMGAVGLVALRAAGHEDRAGQIERVRDRSDLPPGQQKKLDRLPQGPQVPRGQGPGQRGGMGNGQGDGLGPLMRGAMGLGNVQHGEFTVQDNDKATVMTLQRGEVTKVSDTSVTVKSEDDFTATYVLGDDTRGRAANLEVGDSVVVVAEKAGAKAVLVAASRRG